MTAISKTGSKKKRCDATAWSQWISKKKNSGYRFHWIILRNSATEIMRVRAGSTALHDTREVYVGEVVVYAMANEGPKIRGLVMPGDSVIPSGKLKKQFFFFDEVLLSDPSDRALVTDGEIEHVYPDRTAIWRIDKAPFPQQEGYETQYKELIRETEQLQRRGILRILGWNDWGVINTRLRIFLYQGAITSPRIVRSAIPDCSGAVPVKIPNGVIYGCDSIRVGWPRKPPLIQDPPYEVAGVNTDWNTLAYLRVGRAMKYISVAQLTNAAPVAWDDPTSGILLALGQLVFREIPEPDMLAAAAISLDAIDHEQLEVALEELPWSDVIKIRKELLPHVARYRLKVIQTVRRVHRAQIMDFQRYREVVESDHQSLSAAREELRKAWQGLKLVGSLKGLGFAAAGGAAGLLIPTDWVGLLGSILAGVSAGGAAVAGELKAALQIRDSIRRHPLFVIDSALSKVKLVDPR